MSMMTIVLISIWHCLVAVNGTGTTVFPTVVVTNEGYFVIGFAFVYAIMHLIFVLWVYIRVSFVLIALFLGLLCLFPWTSTIILILFCLQVCARRRHVVQDDREFRVRNNSNLGRCFKKSSLKVCFFIVDLAEEETGLAEQATSTSCGRQGEQEDEEAQVVKFTEALDKRLAKLSKKSIKFLTLALL